MNTTRADGFRPVITVTVNYRVLRFEPLGAARLEAPRLQSKRFGCCYCSCRARAHCKRCRRDAMSKSLIPRCAFSERKRIRILANGPLSVTTLSNGHPRVVTLTHQGGTRYSTASLRQRRSAAPLRLPPQLRDAAQPLRGLRRRVLVHRLPRPREGAYFGPM